MERYGDVLLIAIPGFIVLMIIEAVYGWYTGKQTFRGFDTISSLSSGYTNTIKDVLKLTIVVIGYSWLEGRISLIKIEDTIWVYVLTFIALDFAGYWSHRLAHTLNIFWNKHIIHHSSEEFNLACALRQTISNIFGIHAIFLIPAALIGLPPKVIATLAPIHLFLQFWYHTRHIPKLGLLEYIIVTPSLHRVHHAINPEYLDKNFSQIFIIWDRLFGTLQEELDDVPPIYGVKRAVNTWNPFKINFQHLWLLIQDAWRTEKWTDKLRLWFMPTGWRPEDVKIKYPVKIIDDPYSQVKFSTETTPKLLAWSWFQHAATFAMIIHMILYLADIGSPAIFVYGVFILVSVYSYTSLMDREQGALLVELIRSLSGLGIIYMTGDWFLINTALPGGMFLVSGYFILSMLVVAYFVLFDFSKKPSLTAAST